MTGTSNYIIYNREISPITNRSKSCQSNTMAKGVATTEDSISNIGELVLTTVENIGIVSKPLIDRIIKDYPIVVVVVGVGIGAAIGTGISTYRKHLKRNGIEECEKIEEKETE